MKNKISFIGFDLDGTLIDSHKAVYDCLSESLPSYVDDDIDNIVDIIFPLTMNQFPDFIKFKNSDSYELFKKEFIDLFDKKYYKEIERKEGCFDLLKFCQNKYGKSNVFILTNRREKSTLQVCNYLNITNIINTNKIFSTKFDNTKNPKSSSLKHVTKFLNFENKFGYYVGDSISDVYSAIENNVTPIYMCGKKRDSDILSIKEAIKNINYFDDLQSLHAFLKL